MLVAASFDVLTQLVSRLPKVSFSFRTQLVCLSPRPVVYAIGPMFDASPGTVGTIVERPAP